MSSHNPELRWGIIGTGWIASMFVADLLGKRPNAPAIHRITAVGSSSISKGNDFVKRCWNDADIDLPAVYGSYQAVYDSPNVDIIYIATPHALHKQNCLDAIAVGKHVLCEKPFTINAREARDVVQAARSKGVYLMEGVWTRFFPMALALQETIQKGVIGRVRRSIVEIGLKTNWAEQPASSRLKNPVLGGGALLDVGIYPLTFASLIHGNGQLGEEHPKPRVVSDLTIVNGVDESDVVTLRYTSDDGFEQTAICLATVHFRQSLGFGRIEGTEGHIVLFTDKGPSCPRGFRVITAEREEEFSFEHEAGALGFVYEADAAARDIAGGKTESDIMPLAETLRMMCLMDEIRAQSGLRYPQDSI